MAYQDGEYIETEFGTTTVSLISSDGAYKDFLCPLCDNKVPKGEPHSLAVPLIAAWLRRHIHTDCLEMFKQKSLGIRLHPNADPAELFMIGPTGGET